MSQASIADSSAASLRLDVVRLQQQLGAQNVVIYDGECPFCSQFVVMTNVRRALPGVVLVSARDLVDDYRDFLAAVEIDQGMVLIQGDLLFHGAQAFGRINRLSDFGRVPWLGSLARALGEGTLLEIVYFCLRMGRAATLWVLGVRRVLSDSPHH